MNATAPHYLEMLKAIREQVEWNRTGVKRLHGGFVCYMAERNYGRAVRQADAENRARFGDLVTFREFLEDYPLSWADEEIAKLEAEANA